MTQKYSVTIYVAAPGTPLKDGGTFSAGHVYFKTTHGSTENSFGFAPRTHGVVAGPGRVYDGDVEQYESPYFQRTMEISQDQYERLREFGFTPRKYGFDTEYNGASNSCIDYTWGALNHAGLHRTNKQSQPDRDFEGKLKPLENIESIRSIRAPFPDSELNTEHSNPMPLRNWKQFILSDAQLPDKDRDLLQSIRKGVAGIDQQHGRELDETSERISASLLATAKSSGLERVDHVVLGNPPANGSGPRMFVVQGDLDNPAHLRASVAISEAVKTPVEQSLAKVEQISQAQLVAQQGHAQEQTRTAMRMG